MSTVLGAERVLEVIRLGHDLETHGRNGHDPRPDVADSHHQVREVGEDSLAGRGRQ